MGQDVQEICPVNGDHTSEREAGKAVTTVAVPVDWPAAQSTQAMVEAVLYLAIAQAVHVVAPVEASVLVTEPAAQTAQAVVDTALYLPMSQAVQLVAPVLVSVLVTEPALHVVHVL
jgi:hypothetical protein